MQAKPRTQPVDVRDVVRLLPGVPEDAQHTGVGGQVQTHALGTALFLIARTMPQRGGEGTITTEAAQTQTTTTPQAHEHNSALPAAWCGVLVVQACAKGIVALA